MTADVREVIMSEAVARGFSLFNPCRNLGLGRSVVKEKGVITRDEEAAIFAKLRGGGRADYPSMADAFLVAMRQGCCPRDVEIPLSSIDTERMVVKFKTKGNRRHLGGAPPSWGSAAILSAGFGILSNLLRGRTPISEAKPARRVSGWMPETAAKMAALPSAACGRFFQLKMKSPGSDAPMVVVKWYAYAKWVLERVEGFPKSQPH